MQEETFRTYAVTVLGCAGILLGYANTYVEPYNTMSFWQCWVELPEYLGLFAVCCLVHKLTTPGEQTITKTPHHSTIVVAHCGCVSRVACTAYAA